MIDLNDVFYGMRRLNEVLNLASELQKPVMARCMEAGESIEQVDPVQAMILKQDLLKILQPLSDKLLELQTIPLFLEMSPANYPDPEKIL